MKFKIVIIGATGKLGLKLLNYCFVNNIQILAITSYKNINLLNKLKKKHNIKHSFNLSSTDDKNDFINFLDNKKINLIYFLDYGANSLQYLNIFLSRNINSSIAIANKEMIILGGRVMIKKIKLTKNHLIPLDSEHFSLMNSNLDKKKVKKVFITASGGPFYFDKSIDLNKVNFKQVISHPKWKMGINNSIDSSNFINKILEIHELSIIYDIDIKKIDFLISQEAYIHSLVFYNDSSSIINCFNNDMIISLSFPLRRFFDLPEINYTKKKFLDINNFKLEKFNDKRFKISKYMNLFKNLNHIQLIQFIILNNIAHSKYIKNAISYNSILNFIINNIDITKKNMNLNTINSILKYYNSKLNDFKQIN